MVLPSPVSWVLGVSAPTPKAQGLISGQEQRFHKWFVMALSEIKTNIPKVKVKSLSRVRLFELSHLSNPCLQQELEQIPLSQPLLQINDVSSVVSARNVWISRWVIIAQ